MATTTRPATAAAPATPRTPPSRPGRAAAPWPPPRTAWTAWRRRSPAVAVWVSRGVAVTGAVMVAGALAPVGSRRAALLADIVPRMWSAGATAVAAAAGVLLMWLAAGLRRRKRGAWIAVVTLSAVVVVANVARGPVVEQAAIAGALLVVLLLTRREFPARPDPAGRWTVLWAGPALAVAGVTSGLVLLALRDGDVAGRPGAGRLLTAAVLGLAGLSGPVTFTDEPTAEAFALTTGLFGILALAATAWFLLRPARHRGADRPSQARLRALLAEHGRADSLGYFALRRDRCVIFSPSGKAAVTYRVVGGVSLAAGDPIGDAEAWPGAIEAWLEQARAHGWAPAVLGCSEAAGRVYARYGMDALELGDEAVVDTGAFTLAGRAMRGVRQAVSRAERTGLTASVRRTGDLDADERAELLRAADAFRDGPVERGFSMALSRVADPADPECVVVTARDADGVVRGVLQFVPWGPDGVSLDVMRRDRTAPNGVVEFMVVALLRAAPGLGVTRVSLNFAMFRSVFSRGERLGAGPVVRLTRRVLLILSRFWQIESLYRSNAKYRPQWHPRFVCYAAARDLPRIGVAALRAEAFLTRPALLRRRG